MNLKKFIPALICCFLVISAVNPLYSQRKKNKRGEENKTGAPAPSKDVKTIAQLTKRCRRISGLFTLFQDSTNGVVYLQVKMEQLNKEFIYFRNVSDGVAEAGRIRGYYLGSDIITIKRYFNKIEFITRNTSFYFDPSSPLSKASGANISEAVMLSQVIAAEDTSKGLVLIKADDLFLPEVLHQIKPAPSPSPLPSFSLGTLNKDKCKYISIKSYPKNTDVLVEYVYDNASPSVHGGSALADDRYVSIRVQHSWIELPENNFQPRRDDPRIGFFTRARNDMTSASPTPYKDMIDRWNLVKRDKSAALSEPVEPIVWWIENTTPLEYRETIKNAALSWNTAFEKAGFKDAIQVNVQPDTATWDAGDIRYNVLRWTSSPSPQFGAYGPSFTNPRTGEIMGADIMIEFSIITNYLKLEKYFKGGAALIDNPENAGNLPDSPEKFSACRITFKAMSCSGRN